MSMQPLQDNAGAGLSLLDSILHARVSQSGVVLPTLTRLLYVAKLAKGAVPQEICEYHTSFLSEVEGEVTGLMVIQSGSFFNVLEASPEAVTSLLQHIQREINRGEEARITSARVVAFTEDVPERQFGAWSYVSVSLPPEGVVDVSGEVTATLCSNIYRSVITVGQQLKEAGQVALDQIQERFGAFLPSDDRLQAVATTDKVTSVDEWLQIYAGPVEFTSMSESSFPLPPRLVGRLDDLPDAFLQLSTRHLFSVQPSLTMMLHGVLPLGVDSLLGRFGDCLPCLKIVYQLFE